MKNKIRVRFAPSPTGLLHVGNARTALFNYLFSQQREGSFILRLEDTDQQRSSKEAEQAIMNDLRWLGIKWDEGPDRRGLYGPYRQSERSNIYAQYAQDLLEKGLVYRCYCLPAELEEKRTSYLARGLAPRYDGRCRNLTPQEENELIRAGRSPSLRFQVHARNVEFRDLIKGKVSFAGVDIGDFIIMRSDGLAAYNFAAVIDDTLMQVTHVIRGEDHLANTARQLLLYQALEFSPPLFAHLPLIFGPDRTPLSKRHGATAVAHFREEGYLPEALLNYLALLGWSAEDGQEIFELKELMAKFSLERVAKSPAVFNHSKLKWINRQHLKKVGGSKRVAMVQPFLEKKGIKVEAHDETIWAKLVDLYWGEVDTLAQLAEEIAFGGEDTRPREAEAETLWQEKGSLRILATLRTEVERVESIDQAAYRQIILNLNQILGLSGRGLLLPIRAALTGKVKGPELEKIFLALGKEKILNKIDLVLKTKRAERSEEGWPTKSY